MSLARHAPRGTIVLAAVVAGLGLSLCRVAAQEPASVAPYRSATVAARIASFNSHLSQDDPRQLPMKFQSLSADAYAFFRGTAVLYYDWCRENAGDWLAAGDFLTLHGDVHYGNMGTYRTADSSDFLRFGLVDFDEAFEGPIELDLLRGIVSLRLAAARRGIALDGDTAGTVSRRFCDAYAAAMTGRLNAATLGERHAAVAALLKVAAAGQLADYAARYCRGEGGPRFAAARLKKKKVSDLLEPVSPARRDEIVAAWAGAVGRMSPASRRLLRRLATDAAGDSGHEKAASPAIADVARWTRVDSAGSQGLDKFLLLAPGAPGDGDGIGPLIIEFKRQPRPAAERAGLVKRPAAAPSDGERVARATAALQSGTPWLASHAMIGGASFLVRAKDPWSHEPSWKDLQSADDILVAADLLGEVLGHGHRCALSAAHPGEAADRAKRLARRAISAQPLLNERAGQLETLTAQQFAAFSNDPAARQLATKVNELIQAAGR